MKIILGVINDLNSSESYVEKLSNLTDFWIFNATHRLTNVDVRNFKSEDLLLEYAVNNNYDFCIGNWIGHLLRPGQLDSRQVILDTIELCQNSDGLIGHIISYENKIPYFYKEFWCVDLNKYKSLGCPKWISNENNFPNFIRSNENFHDTYTPFFLKPLDGTNKNEFQINWGTGLIKSWLSNGLTVLNFPTAIRELKHHLYPEHQFQLEKYFNNEITVDQLDQPLQLQYFNSVDYNNAKDCIFLFNTDRLDFKVPTVKIDNLVSVCAAFRPYLILHRCGFDASTTVKFIDYSQISLDFKKWLVENWDGNNIKDAVNKFEREIGNPISWNRPFHETEEESYSKVTKEFGSKEEWLQFWDKYKLLNHEYHLLDLVDETDKLEGLLSSSQNYIYYSNSFNTEAGLVRWGKKRLQQSLSQLLTFAEKTNSIVDGSDVDHHYPDPNFVDIVKKDYIL